MSFLAPAPGKGVARWNVWVSEIGLSAKMIDFSLDLKMKSFLLNELLDEPVVHVFTHFTLEANIYLAHIDGRPDASSVNGRWLKPRNIGFTKSYAKNFDGNRV